MLIFLITLFTSIGSERFSHDTDFSKDSTQYLIHSIQIVGNEVTSTAVILREIGIAPKSKVTKREIEYFKDRIYSLGLFTQVEWEFEGTEFEGNVLIYKVTERWYWIMYPIVTVKDGNFFSLFNHPAIDKLQVGGKILHNNFLGERIQLSLYYATGYATSAGFNYYNPYNFFNPNLSTRFGFIYNEVQNSNRFLAEKQGEFTQRNYMIYSGTSYRLNLFNYVGLSLSYHVHANATLVDSSNQVLMINPQLPDDQIINAGLSFSSDKRNSSEFTTEGYLFSTSLNYYREVQSSKTFLKSNLDIRYFAILPTELMKVTFASNFIYQKSYGEVVPYYQHYYLGQDDVLRGYQHLVLESLERWIARFEIRHEIIKPRVEFFDWIPVKQFQHFRWSVYFTGFIDMGYLPLKDKTYQGLISFIEKKELFKYYNNVLFSSGVGLSFTFPYSIFFKSEFALNKFNEPIFWITSGRAF